MLNKNIVLIGFMGVGKTTIGKLVAQQLKREFIDIDEQIEEQFKMPIVEIFKNLGEEQFREAETSTIKYWCMNTRLKVISLGGGAFMRAENREVCLASSIVVYLDLSFDDWKERVTLLMSDRPILQNKSMAEIEELYNKRKPFYALNHLAMSTDGLRAEQVSEQMVNQLQLNFPS
jgi:shikimate kinase